MNRSVLRVLAWFLATGVSVLVANTAVGSVRNQVSESPSAALVSVSSTTSTMSMVPSSSTTPLAPTSSVAPEGRFASYTLTGGTVSIEVFSDRILLLGALPASGYSVAEVEQSTSRIEIEFVAGSVESKFTATLIGAEVVIEIDEPEGVQEDAVPAPASTFASTTATTSSDDESGESDEPDEPDESDESDDSKSESEDSEDSEDESDS